MSLFKRKASKEKDVIESQSANNSPPVNNAPVLAMANGQPGLPLVAAVPYGQVNGGTPPLVNGRRMTSNLAQIPPVAHSIHGQPIHPNGSMTSFDNTPGHFVPNHPGQTPANPQPQSQPPRPPPAAPPTSYPWSTRPLRLYPAQTSPPSAPQSPFPRYGLSVPAFPSHSGHMLIFGGLVHETVRNDMWSMDVRDCSTMPVKTKGDAPRPRVGHASAMADRIMLVWGGDTKVKPEDPQDEGLYILDLRTQEWTGVPVAPGPIGRYGHAVCMHDTRFFVFGGQAEGSFLNDLWAYDIKQLSSDKQHKWEQIQYNSAAPPRRTGHILVSSSGKLYLFGGTDGNYHYNDTWSFDIASGTWTELSCIGYIPVPREGHAAAIVDDVVYIFGGRDVNGKDLGDLAAFRIANQRWYMFQNMGPAPTARSGHAMVAAHGKIFVIGGEANTSSAMSRDDPSQIHVLDTVKIKYPPDNQAPRQAKPKGPDLPEQQSVRDSSPPKQQPTNTPPSLRRQLPNSSSMDSLARATSPPSSSDRLAQVAQQAPPLAAPIETRMIPRSESLDLGQAARPQPNGAPPQRPRREGDDDFRRALSPTNTNGPSSPVQSVDPVRVSSPNNGGPASPPQNPKTGFNASILGTRSPSPRLRMAEGAERPAPPPDAFYYGRSPTANGFTGRPSSLSGTGDVLRELKAKEAEMDAGAKREMALRVIIGRAIQQGFVPGDSEQDLPNGEVQGNGEVVRRLTDAMVRLKQEKAVIQTELVAQICVASEKAMTAEQLRRGALQEAAFFRAKVATLESNSPMDLTRIEKERINDLERQLYILSNEHAGVQRDFEQAVGDSGTHKQLHSAAVEREAEAVRRAEDAEHSHRQATAELDEIQQRAMSSDNALREHTERLITLSSVAQQREAERDHLQSQLDVAVAAREEHAALIEQAQAAIGAAGVRTSEMESMYSKSTARITELEEELAETRAELDARTRDAKLATERLAEVENAYAKSREEADRLRTVTTGRMGELLDSHKEMRADETRLTRGHQEQLRALEEEGKSLRKMLREAGQRVDAAEVGVSQHRQNKRDLETQHQSLRAEMRSHRNKLLNTQTELAKYKELYSAKDVELRDRDGTMTEIETRCMMLRNLLADHGIAINDNDLSNGEASNTRELESKLRERTRAHENSQREVDELTRRCHEAEDNVESLGRLVDRIKDARSPNSMRSPTPPPEGDRRAVDAERKIAELEVQHREKMAALEGDYQTAVRYVKGTEKMLKRMKDELNKQRDANKSLQSEVDSFHGRSSTEPGARTRDASGRNTPSYSDAESSRRFDKLQSQHNAIQAELAASRDVLSAREREVEVLRMRVEEAEREVETLREDLAQAQQRITTLLEMNQPGFHLESEDEDDAHRRRRDSTGSSEEASMAFDKLTSELKQWERSRSPQEVNGHSNNHEQGAELGHLGGMRKVIGHQGHQRHSSENSGDWVQ